MAVDPWIYYARALHWATNTVVNVGFGDIVPTKLEELIFYICTSIVAAAVATTSIGLLIPALKGSDMLKETWLARVERADAFIKRHKIPPELARRIQEYLQYQWLFLRGADESTFFEGLPASLRSEVRFALNHKLLRSIPSFASLDADTIAALAGLLYPVIYTTDEHLLKCSSVADDDTLTIVPQMCSNAWLLIRGMVIEFGMMEEYEDASVNGQGGSFESSQKRSALAENSLTRQWRSALAENSLTFRRRKRAVNRLRQIRTYDEGDCMLPFAATRVVQARTDFRAATFVEVHALHCNDVVQLLAAREAAASSQSPLVLPTMPDAAPLQASEAEPAPRVVQWSVGAGSDVGGISEPPPSPPYDDLDRSRPSQLDRSVHGIGEPPPSPPATPPESEPPPTEPAPSTEPASSTEIELQVELEQSEHSVMAGSEATTHGVEHAAEQSVLSATGFFVGRSAERAVMGVHASKGIMSKAPAVDSRPSRGAALPFLWLTLRLLTACYLALVLPLRCAFEGRTVLNPWWLVADVVTDVVLWLQLWSQHNPARVAALELNWLMPPGKLQREESRRSDRSRFAWLGIAVDVLCCLPYEWGGYAWNPSPSGTPFLMLPRLVRLRCTGSWIGEIFFHIHQKRPSLSPSLQIRRMIYLILFWLIWLHWGGCILLWLGLVRSDNVFAGASDFGTGSWLTWDAIYLRELTRDDEIASPDDEMSPFHAYVRSVYWMIISMSPIGFGDIVPRTIPETWAMLILEAPGSMLYPAIIAAIMSLLMDAMTARTVQATAVHDFVHRNRLAGPLRSQIILLAELGERVRTETKLLHSLPPSLHVLISAHLYLGMVRAH